MNLHEEKILSKAWACWSDNELFESVNSASEVKLKPRLGREVRLK